MLPSEEPDRPRNLSGQRAYFEDLLAGERAQVALCIQNERQYLTDLLTELAVGLREDIAIDTKQSLDEVRTQADAKVVQLRGALDDLRDALGDLRVQMAATQPIAGPAGPEGPRGDVGPLGPQGPEGPPALSPQVKAWSADEVCYRGDIVTHAGATWQAQRDTAKEPPHPDWIELAIPRWQIDRASFTATPIMTDGSEGPPLELRGLFEQYQIETG